jgi:NAD(P)-dependent dehydrogenase (short-subunit alcohol dehydrogenase family)
LISISAPVILSRSGQRSTSPYGAERQDAVMSSKWALVLGASSGFGAATSVELAKAGYGVFGVHFDLRSTLPNAVRVQDDVKAAGQEALFFNINAADPDKRTATLDAMREKVGGDGYVRVLMHSLAFGSLLPFIGDDPKARISPFEKNWSIDPRACGRELRRPTWSVVAFRSKPKATKNDSPNPIIEAAKAPSNIEYLRLFRTR